VVAEVVAERGTHTDSHGHRFGSTRRIPLKDATPEEVQILSPRSHEMPANRRVKGRSLVCNCGERPAVSLGCPSTARCQPYTVNATTVTAFYAAVVSTAALGFHGFQWWHGARTKVVLSAEFEVWRSGSQSLDSGVLVKVVNHSRHDVRVTLVSVEQGSWEDQTPRVKNRYEPGEDDGLPGVIRSKDVGEAWFSSERLDEEGVRR